jgi:hypothetical protein
VEEQVEAQQMAQETAVEALEVIVFQLVFP